MAGPARPSRAGFAAALGAQGGPETPAFHSRCSLNPKLSGVGFLLLSQNGRSRFLVQNHNQGTFPAVSEPSKTRPSCSID